MLKDRLSKTSGWQFHKWLLGPESFSGLSRNGPLDRKTLDSNDQNQVAGQRFSLKQWFAGGAQSRGLRKPGCGHCHLRLFFLDRGVQIRCDRASQRSWVHDPVGDA